MISYFELLQLIKEGKEPKKIKLYLVSDSIGKEYKAEYDCCDFSYYGLANMDEENENYRYYLLECFLESDIFDKKIEIIEENNKIEKLETYKEFDDDEHYANIFKVSKNGEYEINEDVSVVIDKINEIIDKINEMESNND